jgi:hypothetical protein
MTAFSKSNINGRTKSIYIKVLRWPSTQQLTNKTDLRSVTILFFYIYIHYMFKPKRSSSDGKANHVTDRVGPWGCETSKFPHSLDNWPTDGSEAVKPYVPAAFYPQKDSWYSFLSEAESILGPQCGWKD